MQAVQMGGWVFYIGDAIDQLDDEKCGKWMYFFSDVDFAEEICEEAVKTGIVSEAKHSDAPKGVCCFYLNGDDDEGHKRVIRFFLEHNLIRRTKTGKLYNISFKFNEQTRNGEYGDRYNSDIKLDHFLNLTTGEWIV